MMKCMLTITTLMLSQAVLADNCIKFDNSEYCKVWDNKREDVHTVELLIAGQALDSWSTMLTVREYQGKAAIKEVLPGYVNGVKPMFVLKPDIFGPETASTQEEIYLLMLLLAPDKSHYEYVVNRFYRDDDKSVKSVFYSHRIPFAKEVDFNEVMENRDGWLEQLQAVRIDDYLDQ